MYSIIGNWEATDFIAIWIKWQFYTESLWKFVSKWRPSFLGLNVLTDLPLDKMAAISQTIV